MVIDFDSFLLIAVGLSIIGGIVFGLYYNHFISLFSKRKKDRNQSQNSKFKEGEKEKVGKEQKINSNLIKKNSPLLEDEVKIYQFEKDLVSHAIENILAASRNKSIDTFEKDRLLLRYNNQVKQLNEKMEKIQSEIDVTKLLDLRNDLVSLLDNKISAIDEKIKEINYKIGTNYKILEIKNQNKQNNNTNNNDNVNHTNSSRSIEETIDVNLNARKVINYKNMDTNKKKERVIDAERKKIGDLKDQVLVALNRLDRSEDIKQEIEKEVATTINDSENRKDLTEEGKNSLQKAYEFNDKDHLHILQIENNNTLNTAIKNNAITPPAIFSYLQGIQSKNEIITTKAISNPSYDRETTTKSIIKNDESQNKTKKENSFINVNQIKNNKYNNSKNNPLSNILNHSELKFDPHIKIKEEEE